MAGSREEVLESGPTYKILFLGACVVIGSFIGWWATDLKQSVTRVWESLEKLDGRTTALDAGAVEHRYQYYQLQQEVDRVKIITEANAKIIRELEHLLPRKDR